MGSHKPVPGRWVRDIDRSVALQHLDEEGGLHRGVGRKAGAQWVDDRRGAIAEVSRGGDSRAGIRCGPWPWLGQAGRRVGGHLHSDLHIGACGATTPGHLQQPAQQHGVRGYSEVEESGAAIPAVERQLLRGLRELLRYQPDVCGEKALSARLGVPRGTHLPMG